MYMLQALFIVQLLTALHAFAGMHMTAKAHELCVMYMRPVITCNLHLCMCTNIYCTPWGFL